MKAQDSAGGARREGWWLLAPPLLAVGASSLIWQVAAARAILAGLHGSELTLGVVLGSWLVLTGLATGLAARVASPAAARTLLAPLLALLPVGLWASVALQATLPAFTNVGRVVGPVQALFSALLCLAPCCVPLGLTFGLLGLLGPRQLPPARWAARLLVLESLGMVAAGLLFHGWLAWVDLPETALVAGAACWLAALALLARRPRSRVGWSAVLVGSLALLALLPGLDHPGAALLRPAFPGYRILERRITPHAALTVARRGDQVLFLANGVTLFTNQDLQQVEPAVHLALLAHERPRRVLMIGGGLGGGLAQVLAHPVERLDYVELDPGLVHLARRWARPLAAPLDDRRVKLLIDDGRRVVREARGRYDAILVGVPGPSSALINRYYTAEFFGEARRALRPGGLLRVTVEGAESYMNEQMALVHASIRRELRRAFGHVSVLPGATALMLARRGEAPDLRFVTLARRLQQRRLETRHLGQAELMGRTLPFKHELYLERLEQVRPVANTDLHPAVYFRASLVWLALTSPSLSRGLAALADGLRGRPWLVPAGAFVLALLWGLLRRRGGGVPAGFAMAVAGMAGLAVEVALLLVAQEARGVVFHEIGALLTAFMLGLVGGAPLGRRLVTCWPRRGLQAALGATGLVCAAAVGAMVIALRHPGVALPLLLGQMLLVGMAVGACYPAASAALARRRGESAAARAYAWDLGGAAVGALLGSAIAIPVLGLPGTCLTCAALCLGAAATVRR